jgi:hypothetical protein
MVIGVSYYADYNGQLPNFTSLGASNNFPISSQTGTASNNHVAAIAESTLSRRHIEVHNRHLTANLCLSFGPAAAVLDEGIVIKPTDKWCWPSSAGKCHNGIINLISSVVNHPYTLVII